MSHLTKLTIRINLLFALISLGTFGQQDFNHFQTLVSVGQMPVDFSLTVEEKIKLDKLAHPDNHKQLIKSKYLIKLEYSIDELLHSGKVLYGDEMTQYVNRVADHILKDEPGLRKELRFYLIKTNVSNALSTNQGIIFITTGLLSQLTSEAQLAYIMCHEIAHFQERHLLKSFENRLKNRNLTYQSLADFSKENEQEADIKGMKLYNEAGYSKSELLGVFDVLLYSHLPFDELKLDPNYLSGGKIPLLKDKYGSKEYPILAVEDYDDSKSSHPNIKKRKIAVEKEISNYSNWQNTVFKQSKEQFVYIRNLARFEAVRTDIIDMNLSNALYDIYLLEQDFPNSEYLAQMKALSWLGILQVTLDGKRSKFIPAASKFEGEIGKLHEFFKKASKEELITFSIRNIYDLCNGKKEDPFNVAILDRMNESLKSKASFEWAKYSPKSLTEYLATKTSDTLVKDSAIVETAVLNSKYDKIKSKKTFTPTTDADTSQYYIFGLYDILADSAYQEMYLMTKIYNKENITVDASNLQINNIELITKATTSDDKRTKVLGNYVYALDNTKLGDSVNVTVSNTNGTENPTEKYNTQNLFLDLLEETSNYEKTHFLSVDFDRLETFKKNSTATSIGFTTINASYSPDISGIVILYGLITVFPAPFILFQYIPSKLMQGYTTQLNLIVYDLKSGAVKGNRYVFYNRPSKIYLKRHLEQMFSTLNKQ